jgi:hypothetical protein
MVIFEDDVVSMGKNLGYTEAEHLDYDKAQFLDDSFGGQDPKVRAQLMKEFASRHSTEFKTKTLIFSASRGEKLTDGQWKDIITYALHSLGYSYTAYVATRHVDTDVDHIHICLARVDLDGMLLKDSFSWYKCKALAREIERVFGLVPFEERYQEKRLSRREYQAQNHGFETKSGYMRNKIDLALESSLTLTDLIGNLKKDKIETRVKYNKQMEPIGISYSYDGQPTTGRKLGDKYKIKEVISKLESSGFNFPMDFDVRGSVEYYQQSIRTSTSWRELSLKLEARGMELKYDKGERCFFLHLGVGGPLSFNMSNERLRLLLLWFKQFCEEENRDREYQERCENVNGRDAEHKGQTWEDIKPTEELDPREEAEKARTKSRGR